MSPESGDRTIAQEVASPDPDVRWRAAAVLSELPGEESESLLLRLLGDEDYRVREKSLAALARRFTSRVAAACALALADGENAGRRGAGLALLSRAGDAGRAVLLGALQHPSPDVRLAAAIALPGHNADASTVAALEAASRHEADPNARAALLLALGRTGRREAVPALLAALEEQNLWVRVHALEALAEVGDPETAVRLLPLLSHPPLRRAVLKALSRLPSSAPAEELARRAALGEADGAVLAALRHAVEISPAETAARVKALWPEAASVLPRLLVSPDASADEKTDAAHLVALLDLPGGPGLIVRSGPYTDRFGALADMAPARFQEALLAALQEEDPEPAMSLIERARLAGDTAGLSPLLIHSSPAVRAATLTALAPGSVPVGDLIAVLAEEDPETALPAALALAAAEPDDTPEKARVRHGALFDRAGGPDGPGRAAALLALAHVPEPRVDDEVKRGLFSPDADVRRAAAAAAASRDGLSEADLIDHISDPSPEVRATILRTLAAWALGRRPASKVAWRILLPFLADDPVVAAAAGAAIVALAGPERPRVAVEMLAQQGPIRRAALEQIPASGDVGAAERIAFAVEHEDPDTVRAVLQAMVLAPPPVAEETIVRALGDERLEVRQAAADVTARRPAPAAFDGPLSEALAEALASEREADVRAALLSAVAVAGGRSALPPLTAILARERVESSADEAADALAVRFPEDVRRVWAAAPARAERRWARAMSRAAARRSAGAGTA